jgi:hypothetical protein
MNIARRCLSADVLVVLFGANLAWTGFPIPVDEGENGSSSPLAKVNSGLGISGEERCLNVRRQKGLIQTSVCYYRQD